MRHLFKASLLGLPLLLIPSQAHAWGPGGYARKVEFGNRFVCAFGGAPQAGPWYLYWPYEAHFNVSAPPFGSGCAPCGMSWGWMGGNYNAMGLHPGMGAGGYGGAACPGGSCMNPGAYPQQQPYYPNAPQNPALARPNVPAPNTYPAGFQPAAYMQQVPSYWYGR